MKTNHIILAAILAASATLQTAVAENKLPAPKPEFKTQEQLVKWSEEKTREAAAADSASANRDSQFFFTGKPYLEGSGTYAFLFRSYDPELARWTSADPSGFPDGANNIRYDATPTSEFDWQGLKTASLQYTSPAGSFTVKYVLDWTETTAASLQTQTINGGINLILGGVTMELSNGRLADVTQVTDPNGNYAGWTGNYRFEVIVQAYLGFNLWGQTIGIAGDRIQETFETTWTVE